MTIGELMQEKRKQLGLTLEDVGKAVGVSKGTVQRWETGAIHNMKRDKIASLSKVLDLDPTLFIIQTDVLDPVETHLLDLFRNASPKYRDLVIELLECNQPR